MVEPLLRVKDLTVSFHTEDGVVRAVDGVSFTLDHGEVLGIVGESGSGKTVTVMSILRLLGDLNARLEGEVLYKGRDVMTLPEKAMRRIRGREIAMIFQDPMTSLNPVYRVGDQIVEAIAAHQHIAKADAQKRAVDLLGQVGIPRPDRRVRDFPHQFSGGMRQRAVIAMALANDPDILIADEPTTALDVTIQAQILDLIGTLKERFGSAVILVTHDLGIVADIADRIAVMYAGRIVEYAGRRELFYDPQHPYTWGLLGSIPRLDYAQQARLPSIAGAPPSPIDPPAGCRFRPRCAHAFAPCTAEPPLDTRVQQRRHLDRCWLGVETKRAVRGETVTSASPSERGR
jgi:oligopeptide/dipeptide ABC transporter ATP-binding protein